MGLLESRIGITMNKTRKFQVIVSDKCQQNTDKNPQSRGYKVIKVMDNPLILL